MKVSVHNDPHTSFNIRPADLRRLPAVPRIKLKTLKLYHQCSTQDCFLTLMVPTPLNTAQALSPITRSYFILVFKK